jgi:hypothetical protein
MVKGRSRSFLPPFLDNFSFLGMTKR